MEFQGLDEDRQDAVATLLETVATRELVIVLTCVEETAASRAVRASES